MTIRRDQAFLSTSSRTCRGTHGFVQIALRTFEPDRAHDFGFGRQVFRHLAFVAAQQKWPDATHEQFAPRFVAMLFDRRAKQPLEALLLAQQAGHEEMKQRPQFAQMVFQRRTCQAKAVARGQGAYH